MSFRTIQILVILFLGVCALAATTASGTVKFTDGYQQKDIDIPQIKKPFVLLSIEDLSYSAPFSLDLNSSIINSRRGSYLRIHSLVKNASYYRGVTYISVRFLVSPQLKGFELFPIRLNYAALTKTIIPKAANSEKIKKGYFVQGFSQSSILNSISIVSASGNYFQVVLNTNNLSDWVEINFFVIDYSPVSGCLTHNSYDGTIESSNSIGTKNFQFDDSESLQTILGINNIRSTTGEFYWDELGDGEVMTQGVGSLNFMILQLDTECGTEAGALGDRKSSNIPIVQPVFPINNQINTWNPVNTLGQDQTNIWPLDTQQINTFIPIIVPQPTVIPITNYTTTTSTTTQNVIPETFSDPISQTSEPQTVVTQQNTVIPPIPPTIPSVPTQNDLLQKPGDQLQKVADGTYTQQIPTTISAWKILGFVLLAWIVISVLAIPLLCCLLWRSRKRLQQQDQIIRRYADSNEEKISEPVDDIIDKGTDVRLRNQNPIEMKQIPSAPEKITYQRSPSMIQARGSQQVHEALPLQVRATPFQHGEKSRSVSEIHANDSSLKYSKSDIKNPYSEIKNNGNLAQNQLSQIKGSPSQIRLDEPLTFKQNKSRFNQTQEIEYQRNQDQTIPTLIEYQKQSEEKQPSKEEQVAEQRITYDDKSDRSNEAELVGQQSPASSPFSVIEKKDSTNQIVDNVTEDQQNKNSQSDEQQHDKSNQSVKVDNQYEEENKSSDDNQQKKENQQNKDESEQNKEGETQTK